MINDIIRTAGGFAGDVSVWYMDLESGSTAAFDEKKPLIAASVIKLFIMAEAFRQFESGALSPDEEFVITADVKKPSCGALTYMHEGLKVTAMDLVVLMIILSDNTATNMLINRLGMENINDMIKNVIGAEGCALNRVLFDSEASRRGIQNYITAAGVGKMLKMVYDRELVSAEASEKMLAIMLDQRLNGKSPFFLDCDIAHKTGEDDGTTHDAAIVFAEKPFILVMLSNNVDVPAYERFMQDAAKELAEE